MSLFIRIRGAYPLISADQGLLGNNMFAYCLNNPIVYSDASGNAAMICFNNDAVDPVVPWKTHCGGSTNYNGGCNSFLTPEYANGNRSFVEEYLFYIEERSVLEAKHLTFYKGIPVVKLPIGKNAFSYGIMFIGNDLSSVDTVRHEYGHSVHFMQIGVIAYTATVMVPSMACFWGGVPYDIYYSLPWESVAECLGNVKRENYSYLPSFDTVAEIYWIYTQIVSGGK